MAERFQPNNDKSTEMENFRSPKIDNKKSDNDAQDHTLFYSNPTIFPANRSRHTKFISFQQIYGRVFGYSNLFVPDTMALWNDLPIDISNIDELVSFKTKIGRRIY